MSIIELALAIALGIAIVILVPIILWGLVAISLGLVAIPFQLIEWGVGYYQDREKEKELIAKGARNFKVKNGKIYIDDKEEG